jgi:hypothetical protein
MQNAATHKEVKAALGIIHAVAEAIRELGEVPSGHLYARLMDRFSLAEFKQVVDVLKGAGLVWESNAHVLSWVGGSLSGNDSTERS